MTDKKQPTAEDIKKAEEYFEKGTKALNKKEYGKALSFYKKSDEYDPDLNTRYNIGLAYHGLGDSDNAIIYYNEFLDSYPQDKNALINKALILHEKGQYKEAVIFYDKVLAIFPDYVQAWGNKGVILAQQEQYKEAIRHFDEVIRITPEDKKAWNNKAWALLELLNEKSKSSDKNEAQYTEVGICFLTAKKDIIDIFAKINQTELCSSETSLIIAKAMLQGDRHFKNTVGKASGSKLEAYKNIYVRSLQIVALLHVDLEKYEKHVAHYTRRGVAEIFLAGQSKFRLTTVTTANDPSEGKTLLHYLGIEEDDTSSYQAFVGSFIFNPDCLNQFRLYGKEDGREATGVSITVSDGFFSAVAAINKGLQLPDAISKEEEQKEQAKESLYRCIYIDPHTDRVVSVGHKENYVFYREDIDIKDETIQEYKKYKAEIKKEVESSLQELKAEIAKLINAQRTRRDKKRAQQILSGLLIHLRYLVKHVAFREEQECRIIKVEKVDSKNDKVKIDAGSSRMYCETIQLRNDKECYITDIHFGPKATGKELFEDILKRLDLKKKISLHQSDHPFFS